MRPKYNVVRLAVVVSWCNLDNVGSTVKLWFVNSYVSIRENAHQMKSSETSQQALHLPH